MSKLISDKKLKPSIYLLAKNDCPLNCKGNYCDECQFDFKELNSDEQQVLLTKGIKVFLGIEQI